nr:lasso peptide biosynthesis B2 protein [Brevundimonas nasdae]
MASRSAGARLATWRYLAASWMFLIVFRIALRLAPYRMVKHVLPATRTAPAPDWVIARTRWAVAKAARASFGATCLPQALAAQVLLVLQGYAGTVRIGVRRGSSGQIQAHAWVLSGEKIVVGDDDEALEGFSHLTDLGARS